MCFFFSDANICNKKIRLLKECENILLRAKQNIVMIRNRSYLFGLNINKCSNCPSVSYNHVCTCLIMLNVKTHVKEHSFPYIKLFYDYYTKALHYSFYCWVGKRTLFTRLFMKESCQLIERFLIGKINLHNITIFFR